MIIATTLLGCGADKADDNFSGNPGAIIKDAIDKAQTK